MEQQVAGRVPGEGATLAELRRWIDFGGTWRVDAVAAGRVRVALCRCDGGEQVDSLESGDPDLLAFVDAEQPGGHQQARGE